MGTVVIGGLILSTVLTLLIVPAGFSMADSLEKRIGPWLRDRLLSYRPGDDMSHGVDRGARGAARPSKLPPSRFPPGAQPAERCPGRDSGGHFADCRCPSGRARSRS